MHEDHIPEGSELAALDPIRDAPIAAPESISALALNFALKWHDLSIVKDGAMYQSLKAEGKNIRTVGLEEVFETAKRFETWLLGSPERLLKIIETGVITVQVEGDDDSASRPDANA